MADGKILGHDPLDEADRILSEDFYGRSRASGEPERLPQPARRPPQRAAKRKRKPKPTHYKVVCISLYTKDIEQLEETVAELKRRGYTKANKSQLIRYALSQLDLDKLPPPHP
jgi:hypothetical protein